MIDEALAARLRENQERRQVKPDNWAELDLLEQLRWLVENTIQVLQPSTTVAFYYDLGSAAAARFGDHVWRVLRSRMRWSCGPARCAR
jgi:hypothetical protein